MTSLTLVIYILKFLIPATFSILFRVFGLGYTTRRRVILGLAVFVLYMTIVPALLITTIGYGQYTHIASLVMTVGGLSALIFSNDPPGKTILLTLIAGQMNALISVPLNLVRHLFGLSYLALDALLLLVCAVVFFLALRFWAKPMRFIADNMYNKLTAALAIPIVTTIIIYIVPVYPAQNFANNPIYCTAIMMAVEISFFLYLYTLYRSLRQIRALSQQDSNAALLSLSATSMAERLRLMEAAAHQQSLAAHDRRHFNSMILELLEEGKQEDAAAFLRQQSEVAVPICRHYCENTAVNATVSYYVALAEEKGITADISLNIPSRLEVDALELTMAISNLLENAIHGCEALPQKSKKELRFICRYVGRLILEISNPCISDTALDENGHPIPRGQGQGLGTKSVLAFAKKYNAELLYYVENGSFSVRLLV